MGVRHHGSHRSCVDPPNPFGTPRRVRPLRLSHSEPRRSCAAPTRAASRRRADPSCRPASLRLRRIGTALSPLSPQPPLVAHTRTHTARARSSLHAHPVHAAHRLAVYRHGVRATAHEHTRHTRSAPNQTVSEYRAPQGRCGVQRVHSRPGPNAPPLRSAVTVPSVPPGSRGSVEPIPSSAIVTARRHPHRPREAGTI